MIEPIQTLTKRTNILFDEEFFTYLKEYAKKRHTSVGSLVRVALEKTYFIKENEKLRKRQYALTSIKTIRKNIRKPVTKKEIKTFVEYGHG